LLVQSLCHGNEEVSSTGSWCLQDDGRFINNTNDRPLGLGHADADEGLKSFLTIFFSGFRIFDFGAGVGQYGLAFNSTNNMNDLPAIDYLGFDGALNVPEFTKGFIKWADFTAPFTPTHNGPADWVLCLEVGEHIPTEFESKLLSNIHNNNICGAVLSWGIPGQGGKSHVNLKPNNEVIVLMKSLGYEFQEISSICIRAKAQYRWFKNTFMLFKNMNNWESHRNHCLGVLNKKRHELLDLYLTPEDRAKNVTGDFW
jgi:hypothetical protein